MSSRAEEDKNGDREHETDEPTYVTMTCRVQGSGFRKLGFRV